VQRSGRTKGVNERKNSDKVMGGQGSGMRDRERKLTDAAQSNIRATVAQIKHLDIQINT